MVLPELVEAVQQIHLQQQILVVEEAGTEMLLVATVVLVS
jgi:hypothetical protein